MNSEFRLHLNKGAFLTSVAAIAIALPLSALAQQETSGESERIEEIVVTGTRIQRPEAATAIPVVAISAQNLEQSGLTNVTELLTQTPALFNSEDNFDAAGSQARGGGAGVNLLDLRNLGPNRTLVLVDGRRHIAGIAGEAAVDINTIPTGLIERIDVQTGGVSSVYGADGVSGVVNFIMRRDFEGIDIRAQQGQSDFGDADSSFLSATFGTNFQEGRGNFAFSYEFRNDDRVGALARPNGEFAADTLVRNPNDIPDDPNVPDNVFLDRIGWSDSAPGGAIVVDGSFTPAFNGNGQPYDPGVFLPQSGFLAQGGDNTPVNSYQGDLQAETQHHSFNAFFNYDISPTVRFFAEGKFVDSDNQTVAQPSFDFFTFVSEDNPFIPDPIRAAGLGDFGGVLFNRDNFDFGTRDEQLERDLFRTVIGLDGDLTDNMRFEVSYVYGRNETNYVGTSVRIEDRYFAALDAVDAGAFLTGTPNGTIDCRVNLDGGAIADAGTGNYGQAPQTFAPGECVPLNIFGAGSPSQAALDFILTDTQNEYTLEQHVVNAFVSGDLGSRLALPGGPVGYAVGTEFREEKSDFRPDAISTQVATFDPNSGVLADSALLGREVGSFNVIEVFGELNVPILADRPFAELLELTLAARASDYSTIGNAAAWSVGGQWSFIPDVRLRGSVSESVRAPNITELFAPRTGTFLFLQDPCSPANINQGTEFRAANCEALINGLGADFSTFDFDSDIASSASIEGIVAGNTALSEETAETWTAGVVLEPRFVPNLTVTIDWYDITLSDAVRTPTLTETAEFCVDSADLSNVFCDSVTRDTGTAFVSGYVLGPQNVAFLETAGADLTANYTFEPANGQYGTFFLGATLGYLDKLEFLPANGGIVDVDQGEIGAPEWSGVADVTWQKDNLTINYGLQYVGEQLRFERDAIAGDPDIAAPEFLELDSRVIHDLRFEIATKDQRARFFIGANNLTNELPARGLDAAPTGFLGRYFYAGFRYSADQFGR
ncbi:MAG: TonB-dependent receptor [Pseudomonadota bacterium]